MRTIAFIVTLLLIAASAPAQTVVAGSQSQIANIAENSTPPYTLVDLTHPATADGTLTTASVKWAARSCTSAYKVKFLRPSDTFSLTTYTLVAERGPFTSQPGFDILSLTPPVDVKQGDLIAVTSLVSFSTCGSPAAYSAPAE